MALDLAYSPPEERLPIVQKSSAASLILRYKKLCGGMSRDKTETSTSGASANTNIILYGSEPVPVLSERLNGNAALPGNKIVLTQRLGTGSITAAGGLNNPLEDTLADTFDGFFVSNDPAGIDVDNVRHALCQLGVAGDLDYGGNRIAGRRP